MRNSINKVVIVGGGTAGWITAALLAKVLGETLDITLVESKSIGIIGVGEATIPPIIPFHNAIGVSEAEFIRATNATIKLGIQFENWGNIGDSYMHAFGEIGKNFPFCEFHHFWTKSRQMGIESSFWDFSLNFQAAKNNKFAKVKNIEGTNLPGISYAYHFDANLYANFLGKYCKSLGVKRIDGKITDVKLKPDNGYVASLMLENKEEIAGDLFIDCSGLVGLLIEKTLSTGYEDWSHWLPCNRAVAVPCESSNRIIPYTRSIAHDAGWQWHIPLQNRIGNGLVFSDKHYSDDEATQKLLNNLEGKTLAEPRIIPFRTGRRLKQWNRNVIANGLAAGFFEPLESTNLHLAQTAAIRLLKFFPHKGIKQSEIDEFNAQSKNEYERIRDFIILHYKLTNRNDSEFWRQCKRMDIPDSLKIRMELFSQTGKIFREQEDLFTEIAWKQVMIGQGGEPHDFHPLVDTLNENQISELMQNLRILIKRTIDTMPEHTSFLERV